MELVRPTTQYKEQYLDFVRAFQADTQSHYKDVLENIDPASIECNFAAFVEQYQKREQGIDLAPGRVPDTYFWAIVDEQLVGQISIRHELTETLKEHGGHIGYAVHPVHRGQGCATKMLAQALSEAKQLGITKVLIMCSKENLASKRVIEKNGGVFEKESVKPETGETTLQYWIDL